MDSSQIMSKKKLGFFETLKEALKIITKHPNFISLLFIISLPLFSSMLLHEIVFQPTWTQLLLLHSLSPDEFLCELRFRGYFGLCTPQHWLFFTIKKLKEIISPRFLLLSLVCSGMTYFLDLLNTITTVYAAAITYGGNNQMGLKEMLIQPIRKVGLKGPLTTSLFALLLASLTQLGLLSLSINTFMILNGFFYILLATGSLFLAILTKYIEWSAVWNMAIVTSILDKNSGYIAIGVSAYLSRGSRRLGFNLMLAFFVWRVALRFPCFYIGWKRGSCGIWGNVIYVCLSCIGNVMMWVVCMVYFYGCKTCFLEKKIDVEDGKAVGSCSTMN